VDTLQACTASPIRGTNNPLACDGRGTGVVDDYESTDSEVSIGLSSFVALRSHVEAGPPPVTYQPPMPPKFLPVPARPVFANVNPLAPVSARGAAEIDFVPQLAIPGRD